MKVANDRGLEPRDQATSAVKRRYEPPRLVTETVDVRGTEKTNPSIIDQHNSTIGSGS